MDCCTCGALARSLGAGDFDGIVVECARCGTYEVGSEVLNSLLRLSMPQTGNRPPLLQHDAARLLRLAESSEMQALPHRAILHRICA
jgi:hypothetical protein